MMRNKKKIRSKVSRAHLTFRSLSDYLAAESGFLPLWTEALRVPLWSILR